MERSFWYGIEGVQFIGHGDWSDFEVRYGKVTANGPTVEDKMLACFFDEFGLDGWKDEYEDKFCKWMQEHRDLVIETILQCTARDCLMFLTEDMMDFVDDEFVNVERNYFVAVLKYKGGSIYSVDDFGQRIEEMVKEYTDRIGLEEDWWKQDYRRDSCAVGTRFYTWVFEDVDDLVKWYYEIDK